MSSYTKLRSKLAFEKIRYFEEEHAYFTHFIQTANDEAGAYYRSQAKRFLEEKNIEVNDENLRFDFKFDVPFPPPENPTFTFIDLFAGIGGFRLAMQKNNGKCVFSSEWDKFAKKTYEANYGEVPFGDITKIHVDDIPEHDLLCAGFPCQPFSIAGVSKKNSLGRKHGFEDETQGTLFFDIKRIIKAKRPKAFILENVKNLVSHDKGNTFRVITETLEKLDYSISYKVLDGKHFVPQHRERIFIVGFDKNRYGEDVMFEFPELPPATHAIEDILKDVSDPKYTLSDKLWEYLQNYAAKHKAKGNGFGYGTIKPDGITRTLSARYYKDGAEILVPQEGKNPRRLTPRECCLLQGYPKDFEIPVSDNQAYKQFGNSVVMLLIKFLGKSIIEELERLENL